MPRFGSLKCCDFVGWWPSPLARLGQAPVRPCLWQDAARAGCWAGEARRTTLLIQLMSLELPLRYIVWVGVGRLDNREPENRVPGQVMLRLLTGEAIPLADGEFLRIAIHRYLLLFYALIVGFIFVANSNPTRDAVPLDLRLIGYGSSVLVGVIALFLSATVFRRISLRRTGQEVISFPVALAITVACSVLYGEVLTPHLYGDPMAPIGQILIKLGFYVVTVEVAAAAVMYALLPRILSHLRKQTYRTLSDLIPQPEGADLSSPIQLAGHDLNLESLIRMEVDGDMIRIISTDGQRIAQGPLSQLVETLPDDLGIMVHRSDWVARAAVVGTTRIGRSRALRMRNGDVVRVASSRDAVVAEWLRYNGLV